MAVYHEHDWAARMLENWAKWTGDAIGYARSLSDAERDKRAMQDRMPYPVIAADAEITDRALRVMPIMSVIALVRHHRAPFPSWWQHHRNLRCKRRQEHNVTKQAHHDFRSAWLAIKVEAADRRERLANPSNPSTGAASSAFR